ncbi:MAG: cysteine desulfurase [Thermoplasmata archaeon]|nr:MAG: cysteine desulfurase [Thermoplasmata archaeon]
MDVGRIREDFPLLQRESPPVYLDSACMALKPRQVLEAVEEYYLEYPGCHGRSLHSIATKVTEKVSETREKVARMLGADENEIVFTKNSTEALNLLAYTLKLERGKEILGTDKEHNSNFVPWLYKAEREGLIYRTVPLGEEGTFSMENFREMLSSQVGLVAMVHTSNLDGTTIPAKEIIEEAHEVGALVVLDAAQSVPHRGVNVKDLDVDFLVFSGHKMMGPTGTGVLYGKWEHLRELSPFILGGDTVRETRYDSYVLLPPPMRFEAGLQNYAGLVGLGAAVDYLMSIPREEIREHEVKLNRVITDGIRELDGVHIIGSRDAERRGSICSFYVPGINPQDIAIYLDQQHSIEIRSGMHCVHSWFLSRGIRGSARASIYIYNTEEEAKRFVEALRKMLE